LGRVGGGDTCGEGSAAVQGANWALQWVKEEDDVLLGEPVSDLAPEPGFSSGGRMAQLCATTMAAASAPVAEAAVTLGVGLALPAWSRELAALEARIRAHPLAEDTVKVRGSD
jgi:hypothetical protein